MRWYQHRFHTPSAHRIVFTIIPRLPKFAHPPIAVVTALIFFFILKKERRAVRRNLRQIRARGGARLLWDTYRVFYSFCDFVVSYCYVPHASDRELLEMLTVLEHGADEIDRWLRQGNGLILWTAHLGNWEFASRLLELHGRRVNVARVVEKDNPSETMLRDLMTNDRLRIIQLNDNPLASIELLGALRAGEIVAMQGDRTFGPNFASLPFFGSSAPFPLGPFALSRAAGAPVLPGIVVRDSWLRYRVIVGEAILPQNDTRAALDRAVRFLEENVRRYDYQWLNFYEFWPPDRHNGHGRSEPVGTGDRKL
jgi:KDO2-lipid IV(A) lauroyltransferase